MSTHICPACEGKPAKPTTAFFNTGPDWRKHYAAEVTLTCQVCKATGIVTDYALMRYHKGRKHMADRKERGETLFHAAQRLGVSSSQLSAYELGYADLPNTHIAQRQGNNTKESGND
jgi:RecJ-like exonuclease